MRILLSLFLIGSRGYALNINTLTNDAEIPDKSIKSSGYYDSNTIENDLGHATVDEIFNEIMVDLGSKKNLRAKNVGVSTQDKKDYVIDRLNMVANGIVGGKDVKKGLANIQEMFAGRVFNIHSLKETAHKEDLIREVTRAKVEDIQGEDISTFSKNYAASLSVSGEYGNPVGMSVSGGLSSEFASTSDSSSKESYAQLRQYAQYAMIKIPVEKSKLRAIAEPSMLEAIDQITSKIDAEEFIKTYGVVYFDSAVFGAIFMMSSKSSSYEFNTAFKLQTALDVEYNSLVANVSAKAKISLGTNKGNKNKNLEIKITADGGDPAKILKGDHEGWIDSMKDNLSVVHFHVAPISDFASKPQAKDFLDQVIMEIGSGVEDKYKSPGKVVGSFSKLCQGYCRKKDMSFWSRTDLKTDLSTTRNAETCLGYCYDKYKDDDDFVGAMYRSPQAAAAFSWAPPLCECIFGTPPATCWVRLPDTSYPDRLDDVARMDLSAECYSFGEDNCKQI